MKFKIIITILISNNFFNNNYIYIFNQYINNN